MTERTIEANGIRIWTEDFGDRRSPPVLLVMGATAQGTAWPEPFIERIVAGGRYVIRYDNRDTGLSTCLDFARTPYTLDDLAADAVGVLDAYDLPRAHIVGASMGGMIAQVLMIRHAARLLSATIVMSSPISGSDDGAQAMSAPDLEGPDPEWLARFAALGATPAATLEQQVEQRAAMFRLLAGRTGADEQTLIANARRELGRAVDFAAANNHSLAIAASSPRDRRGLLRATNVPTVVIHGTDDPILPYPHGKALAEAIPGARLLTLDGAGHDLPPACWDEIVRAILSFGRA